MKGKSFYQLRNKKTGLWWGGHRGWSKTPKVYKRLGDLRSAISYHKDWWRKVTEKNQEGYDFSQEKYYKDNIRKNKYHYDSVELEIVEFRIVKHTTYPVDLE